jgi:photosystem II stability/assembly factor-like uncharacterized protein
VKFQRAFRMLSIAALCAAIAPCSRAQRWERLGPEGGDVLSMVASSDGTVYLGTADGHVFATQDRGAHWELRGRAGARLDGVVQELIVDRTAPQRLYAAVWFLDPAAGGGVFRSDNGGRSWEAAGLTGEAVRAIAQAPSNPGEFVAGTRSGVFRTLDGGKTWARISPAGDAELRNIDSVAVDPRSENSIYVGTYHLPWKTADGGKTWKAIPTGMIDDSDIMSLRIDSADPETVFASACSGIYRSENGGDLWVKLQGIPFSSRRTQEILQDRANPRALYAATTEGLWITSDRGENWKRVTPREWVINAVAALPSSAGRRILIGTEGRGVLESDDDGRTFAPSNRGFIHPLLRAFAADPKAPGHLLIETAGPQNEFLETEDEGKNWNFLAGGAPAREASGLFGSQSGWWAALEGGGAARYDDAAKRWRTVRFLASYARDEGRGNAGLGGTRLVQKAPQVRQVSEEGEEFYLATSDGLWKGSMRGETAGKVNGKFLGRPIQDVWTGDEVCAVEKRELRCLPGKNGAIALVDPPERAGELLWAAKPEGDGGGPIMVGTMHGVFEMNESPSVVWRPVESGLPAVASLGVVRSGSRLGIATETGGFYVSSDGGRSWARMDQADETGSFLGVSKDGAGGFFVGSKSEGVLHWMPAGNEK